MACAKAVTADALSARTQPVADDEAGEVVKTLEDTRRAFQGSSYTHDRGVIDKAIALINQQEREWISVDDELPDPGKKVIVYYKNYNGLGRTIMAYHAPRWTIESDAEAETYDEYNEVLDCYYAMPGWYEQIDNWPDYASCFVNEGEITHWKPAPPEPEQNND